MIENLKKVSNISLAIIAVLAAFVLPFLFFEGAVWVSAHLLPAVFLIGLLVVLFDLVILLPLSMFRQLRQVTGGLIYLSSFLFGLVTWFYGLVLTYTLWGAFATFVGLGFFGVGVVFMAILATLFKAMWEPFFTVIIFAAVTYASRLAGYAIGNAQPARPRVIDLAA